MPEQTFSEENPKRLKSLNRRRCIMDQQINFPLTECKHVCMRMDSCMTDLYEIREHAGLNDEDRNMVNQLIEYCGIMEAGMINLVRRVCDEEEFIEMKIGIDPDDPYDEPVEDFNLDNPMNTPL